MPNLTATIRGVVGQLLGVLNTRNKDVISRRFGLKTGKKETHHVNVWKWFNSWANDGSLERAFIKSVRYLKDKKKLKFKCINGDGNNSLAKKGAIKSGIPGINTKLDKR